MTSNKICVKSLIGKIAVSILLLTVSHHAVAQYSQSERKLFKTAHNYFTAGQYEKALPLYLKLDSIIDDINLPYHIGICYLNSQANKYQSIKSLEEVAPSSGTLIPMDAIIYLGDAYHVEYRFEDAIKEYNKYIAKTAKSNNADINKLNYCKRMITVCETAIKIMDRPYKVKIEAVSGLFSTESDYFPLISADESIMLLMREYNFGKGVPTTKSIMISTKDSLDNWRRAEKVEIVAEHKLLNHEIRLAGLSPDGRSVFLNIGDGLNQDIYIGQLQGKTISDIKKLNKNINTPYYEGAASITPDGTKLYFVSDRPGGLGGRDIYVSTINKKGEWGEPENLGDKVNTKYDEDAPTIHYDGRTLFFSSEGHKTMGGRDIFRTTRQFNGWTDPENMGFTNTTLDDFNFMLNASGETGYFASSKNNPYNRQSIMKADYTDPIPLTLVKGTVKAGNTGKPLKVDIKVYDKNTQEEVKYVYTPDSKTGKYLMIFPPAKNYQLVISTPNFMPQLISVHIPYQNYFYELYQEITLSPIELNNKNIGEEVVVNNIFYDIYQTNEADSIKQNDSLKQPLYYEHLLDLVENIIQTSDTISKLNYSDATYTKGNKQKLKENTDNLLNMIEDAINTNDPVTLSILDANSKQKGKVTETHFYTDGDKNNSQTMQVIGRDTFYTAAPIDLSRRYSHPRRVASNEDKKESKLAQFKTSQQEQRNIIYTHTIYYGNDLSELTAKDKKNLQQIINLLIDNDKIGAEINGYADKLGETEHNYSLSQRRAQNVLKYLLEQNVDGRKIITQGHGESTEHGRYEAKTREMNYRRVEINLFELKD